MNTPKDMFIQMNRMCMFPMFQLIRKKRNKGKSKQTNKHGVVYECIGAPSVFLSINKPPKNRPRIYGTHFIHKPLNTHHLSVSPFLSPFVLDLRMCMCVFV